MHEFKLNELRPKHELRPNVSNCAQFALKK